MVREYFFGFVDVESTKRRISSGSSTANVRINKYFLIGQGYDDTGIMKQRLLFNLSEIYCSIVCSLMFKLGWNTTL